jgi:tetratricopeptide (TPR) repeat protein
MGTFLLIGAILAFIVAGGAFFFLFESKSGVAEKALGIAALGRYTDARAMIRDQLDLNSEDLHLLYLMAKIYQMEGDSINESQFLEKIVSLGKYDKQITPAMVSSRLGDIYYERDMFDESFFYYLETLDNDPKSLQALVRLAFMCLGQREFQLAENYFSKVNEGNIKFSAYFVGRGIVATMLEKNNEFDYYKKAYELDQESVVNTFLYAMALFRARKFKEAAELASGILDYIHEDYLKFTVHQFLMVQHLCLNDYLSAIIDAKLCIEIAFRNDWDQETADSNLQSGLLHIAQGDIRESVFYVTEAEYRRPNDPEFVNLAQYRFDLEEGLAKPGMISPRGYNFPSYLQSIPEKLFPGERAFELSGLKMSLPINIRGMVNQNGARTINRISMLAPDRLSRFIALRGNAYKNICTRIMGELGFKVKKELPSLEAEGVNYIGVAKNDDKKTALFRFRRWRNITISDVFLNEVLASIQELNVTTAYIVGSFELSIAAKRLLKSQDGILIGINSRELDELLEKTMK